MTDFHCPVCANDTHEHLAIYSCGHKMCAICSLTQRVLQRQLKCVVCKDETQCIIHPATIAINNYRDYESKHKNSDLKYSPQLKTIIHRESQNFVSQLTNPSCPVCDQFFNTFEEMRTHLELKHKQRYCFTCLQNKPLFKKFQQTYSQYDINVHTQLHDRCKLCEKMQYDRDALQEHYRTSHIKCELCIQMSVKDSFWSDNDDLVQHYQEAHFSCPNTICQRNMIGFITQRDQLTHFVNDHSEDFPFEQLQKYRQQLIQLTGKQLVDINGWSEYEQKYSIKNRASQRDNQQQKVKLHRTDFQNKQMEDNLNSYLENLQIQNIIKKSEREASQQKEQNHYQKDELGHRIVEFVEPEAQQQNANKTQQYHGMQKSSEVQQQTEQNEAEPVVQYYQPKGNSRIDVVPTIVKKTQQRKQKQRDNASTHIQQQTQNHGNEANDQSPSLFQEFYKQQDNQEVKYFEVQKSNQYRESNNNCTSYHYDDFVIPAKKKKEYQRKERHEAFQNTQQNDQEEKVEIKIPLQKQQEVVQYFKIQQNQPDYQEQTFNSNDTQIVIQQKKQKTQKPQKQELQQQKQEPQIQSQEIQQDENVFSLNNVKNNCTFISCNCFGSTANEITLIRVCNSKIAATMHIMIKYQGKYLEQLQNLQNTFQEQEQEQNLVFYSKPSYKNYLKNEKIAFKVSNNDQIEELRNVIYNFCAKNDAILQKLQQQYDVDVNILDNNISTTIKPYLIITQINSQQCKNTDLFLKQIQLDYTEVYNLDQLLNAQQNQQLNTILTSVQKEQCTFHSANNQKSTYCTFDCCKKGAEFLINKVTKLNEIKQPSLQIKAETPKVEIINVQPETNYQEIVLNICQQTNQTQQKPVQQKQQKQQKNLTTFQDSCIILNTSSFDQFLNEISATRIQKGEHVASIVILIKYDLEIKQIKDTLCKLDKNKYKQEEKRQNLALYSKSGYGDFIKKCQKQFLQCQSIQETNDKISEILAKFSSANYEELEQLQIDCKLMADIQIINKNITHQTNQQLILLQEESEITQAQQILSKLKLYFQQQVNFKSLFNSNQDFEKMIDHLNTYQKRSYCQFHTQQNTSVKCAMDWVTRSVDFLSKLCKANNKQENVQQSQQENESKPQYQQFIKIEAPKQQVGNTYDETLQQQEDGIVIIHKKQQALKQKQKHEAAAHIEEFNSTIDQIPLKHQQQKSDIQQQKQKQINKQQVNAKSYNIVNIVHVNMYNQYLNEFSVVKLQQGRIVSILHCFVRQNEQIQLDLHVSRLFNIQKIPMYNSLQYKLIFDSEDKQLFHQHKYCDGNEQAIQLLQYFLSINSQDLMNQFKGQNDNQYNFHQIKEIQQFQLNEQPLNLITQNTNDLKLQNCFELNKTIMSNHLKSIQQQLQQNQLGCTFHKKNGGCCSMNEVMSAAVYMEQNWNNQLFAE